MSDYDLYLDQPDAAPYKAPKREQFDEPDTDLEPDGDWGSDERDRLLESTYDR